MQKMIYSLLVIASGFIFSVQAADSNIEIKGNFIATSCNLHTDSQNMSVPMGSVQRSDLTYVGATSTPVDFNINLTDCVPNTSVAIKFEGITDPSNTSLMLDSSSEAKGVGLSLTDQFNSVIRLNTSYPGGAQFQQLGPERTLKYKASYIALEKNITPGSADTTVQISLIYY